MTFDSLSIVGFKTFRRPAQVYRFPQRPGLYLIGGKNLVNPDCGSNGAGKSSLLDALSWVLFGKTARGLKNPDVANWEQPGETRVRLKFHNGENRYNLERGIKPNRLLLRTNGGEWETVTQETVDDLLDFNHDVFLSVILMGQFNRFFFDLGATEKLQVFSDIFDLQYWNARAQHAAALAATAEENNRAAALRRAEANAQLTLTREQIAEAKQQIETFAAGRETKIVEAKRALVAARVAAVTADDAYRLKRKQLKKLPPDDEPELDTERKRVDGLRRQLTANETTLEKWVARLWELSSQRNKLERAAGGGVCPTCGNEITNAKHLKKEIAAIELDQRAMETLEREMRGGLVENRPAVERAERRLARRVDEGRANRKTRGDLADRVAELDMAAENAANRVLDARNRLKTARNAVCPAVTGLETLRNRAQRLKTERAEADATITETAARLNGFTYWKTEFKNLRLWLIADSLVQLSVEVNNSLMALGLRGWQITFEIERLTKAGTVSRGFNIFIQSPESPERVKWECWSGGETTRLRVAGAIGLSTLIRKRFGLDIPLECFDEPTAYLSVEGTEGLLAFLADRAVEEKRAILLVAHGITASGHFAGRTRIVRTAKRGSCMFGLGATNGD